MRYVDLRRTIVCCGKGYPDVSTHELVHFLSSRFGLRVLALVDGDPHGIEIAHVYACGSKALARDHARLALESADTLEWLGVRQSDLLRAGAAQEAMLPLTSHDRRKALSLLRRNDDDKHTLRPDWRRELERMLWTQRKAEIQALDSLEGGLASYLDARLGLSSATDQSAEMQ